MLDGLLDFGRWLVDGLLWLLWFVLDLGLSLVEAVIMLLPDPMGMPGLPGGAWSWDMSFIAAIVDMAAVAGLVQLIATVEVTLLAVMGIRWVWGWVKW